MILHRFSHFYYSPPTPHNNLGTLNTMNTYSPIDTSAQYVYVDIEKIRAFHEFPGGTSLFIDGTPPIHVKEHISEIIAILEGRDPAPSKILFGKNNATSK